MLNLKPTDMFVIGRGSGNHKCTKADLNQLVAVGDVAPVTPRDGTLWLNSTNGILYTYNASETVWLGRDI